MLSTDSSITDRSNAIPLTIVTSETLADFLKHTDATTKSWLNANSFTAAPYSFSLVPDTTGNVASVVVGARALDDVYLLSHLPFALPAGRYRLGDGSTIDDFCASLSWLLGSYQFSRYKSSPRKTAALLLLPSPATIQAQQIFAAVALTRDLVNTPTEDMGPQH